MTSTLSTQPADLNVRVTSNPALTRFEHSCLQIKVSQVIIHGFHY